MVHTRINERTPNPNSHINFIRALPALGTTYGSGEDAEAREMLRALAAQLRPVMKQHGLTVNSFEEYESNKVFLGRNWNNGETIELVLRDGNGRFYPASRLLGVFCHELAHIKHMNHSNAFHALRRQLSSEVIALQRRGYYGDGYWSAGTRLADSECISGDSAMVQELPEYTCGGAHAQSRTSALPSSRRRRRIKRPAGPSLSSGAQNAKKRKAGSRITSHAAFEATGKGSILDERVEKSGKGSGFRKQAGSKRGREERALAAERRLMALQASSGQNQKLGEPLLSETETETDEEATGSERVAETDGDRLRRMRDVLGEDDLKTLRDDIDDGVVIMADPDVVSTSSVSPMAAHEEQSQIDGNVRDKNDKSAGGEKEEMAMKNRRREAGHVTPERLARLPLPQNSGSPQAPLDYLDATSAPPFLAPSSSSRGSMLREEVQQRKREALGMDRPRGLGSNASGSKADAKKWTCGSCTFINVTSSLSCAICEQPRLDTRHEGKKNWSCRVCTFDNGAPARKCAICNHQRG